MRTYDGANSAWFTEVDPLLLRYLPLYDEEFLGDGVSTAWWPTGNTLLVTALDVTGTIVDVIGTPRNWSLMGVKQPKLDKGLLSQKWGHNV